MGCCANTMTQDEHDKLLVGQCPQCGGDVDANGDTIELDDCIYSPVLCERCSYCPCDQFC